jgi:hypothetical protein
MQLPPVQFSHWQAPHVAGSSAGALPPSYTSSGKAGGQSGALSVRSAENGPSQPVGTGGAHRMPTPQPAPAVDSPPFDSPPFDSPPLPPLPVSSPPASPLTEFIPPAPASSAASPPSDEEPPSGRQVRVSLHDVKESPQALTARVPATPKTNASPPAPRYCLINMTRPSKRVGGISAATEHPQLQPGRRAVPPSSDGQLHRPRHVTW